MNVGNELAFSSDFSELSNLDCLESAYIFEHKPQSSKEFKDNFPFDQTSVFLPAKQHCWRHILQFKEF